MTTPDPDNISEAGLAEARRPSRVGPPQYVLLGLIVVQLVLTLRYLGVYWGLARDGASPVIALAFGVQASVCLYFAAVLMLVTRARGKLFFLLAAAGFVISVPFWFGRLSEVAALGAACGAAGWWLARKPA